MLLPPEESADILTDGVSVMVPAPFGFEATCMKLLKDAPVLTVPLLVIVAEKVLASVAFAVVGETALATRSLVEGVTHTPPDTNCPDAHTVNTSCDETAFPAGLKQVTLHTVCPVGLTQSKTPPAVGTGPDHSEAPVMTAEHDTAFVMPETIIFDLEPRATAFGENDTLTVAAGTGDTTSVY